MAEARRYFRHLIPGLFFLVELAILFVVSYWAEIEKFLFADANGGNNLTAGVALVALGGSVVGAGTFGYLLSMVHHLVTGVPNYRKVLQWAENEGKIRLILRDNLKKSVGVSDLRNSGTWMVLTSVWLQNVETLEELKSAHTHTESLGSICHGLGATMWGSGFALFIWLGAIYWWPPDSTGSFWWVLVVGVGLSIFVVLNFIKVRKNFFGIIEIVFCSALDSEKAKTPYKVWVRQKELRKNPKGLQALE